MQHGTCVEIILIIYVIIYVNIHVLLKNVDTTVVSFVFNMFNFVTLSIAKVPVVGIATH
jgi:hypothetical protein